ncbi:hypothetical protein KR222_005156, partial [Zaprionus bogoriensis]
FLCGAHLNPWVSACAAIVKVMDWQTMLCYFLCQLLGSLVGAGMALGAAANNSGDICLTMSKDDVWRIICLEFMATALLLFAYCAIWDKRSNGAYDSLSLRVGLIIAGLCYAIGGYTGCSVNFFRSLSPAICALKFDNLWCYLVGQIIALLVPVLWRFAIAEDDPEKMD